MKRCAALLALAMALGACGSRSGLGVPSAAGSGGVAGTAGAGGTAGTAGTAGTGGSVTEEDRCASAVAGPKAMWGSCSTRDGRSRVLAPTKPHVTWTTKLPTDSTGRLGLSAVATGASNDVYVVTTENFADKGAIRRLSATDGGIAWTLELAPDTATRTPVILATGVVDLFAYDSATKESLLQIDAKSGTFTTTTFGFDLYYGPPDPAVGEDGSLYLVHSENVGTANSGTFISRVRPDGVVVWTTPKLTALVGSPASAGDVYPSMLALGEADVVITIIGVITPKGEVSVAVALDAASGAVLWQTPVTGQHLGGPAVRPDGTIAILVGPANAAELVLLDPHSGAPTAHPLSFGAFELYAVTRTGVVLAGKDSGNGVDSLVALDGEGKTLWTKSLQLRSATVASDGTIVGFGPTLVALDPATGATRWELSAPSPGSCVADAALTSGGRIVGLQCDGTVFGAGD